VNTICVSYISIRLVFNRYYMVATLYSITCHPFSEEVPGQPCRVRVKTQGWRGP